MSTIRHPEEVLQLLQAPQSIAGSARRTLVKNASIIVLLEALVTTDSDIAKQSMCYVLGIRGSKRAIPILITLLAHPASGVRSAAAESLAKIGSNHAGIALLEHYRKEVDIEAKRMYAVVLGSVCYTPAIPALVAALSDTDASLRGSAAWSLGELGDVRVLTQLKTMLDQEKDRYAREQLQKALEVLQLRNSI